VREIINAVDFVSGFVYGRAYAKEREREEMSETVPGGHHYLKPHFILHG